MGCVLRVGVGVGFGGGVGGSACDVCGAGVDVFGGVLGVGCGVGGGVGGGLFDGGGVVCFGVDVVLLGFCVVWGSCWGVVLVLVPSRSLRQMGVCFGVTCPPSHSLRQMGVCFGVTYPPCHSLKRRGFAFGKPT